MPDTKVCPQCGRTYPTDDRFCTVDGAALLSSGNSDTLIGAVLAERYLVREKLGEGGMGEVYLAEHVRMKRKVAVKLMRSWMARDPVAVSRFHREAENASQITHPNVAQVYDFGETEDGMIYLAMEFVPGEPLSKILEREGRLPVVRASEIVRQTADALVAAHHMGILHRDLKPDNVMVARSRTGTDIVKLVDFGIARAMNRGTQQVTSTGMIVGTPDYMSPEQFTGDTLDERSDLYALALIGFRALTGQGAFAAGATGEALVARLTNSSLRLSDALPDVPWPEALQAAFDMALAANPRERYDNALQFAVALDAAVSELPLTPEDHAYMAALAQRLVTPARLGVVQESRTPSGSALAIATPSAERPQITTGARPPINTADTIVSAPPVLPPAPSTSASTAEAPRASSGVDLPASRAEDLPAGRRGEDTPTAYRREETPTAYRVVDTPTAPRGVDPAAPRGLDPAAPRGLDPPFTDPGVDLLAEGAAQTGEHTDPSHAPSPAPEPEGALLAPPRRRSRRPAAVIAIGGTLGIAALALLALQLSSGTTERVEPSAPVTVDSLATATMPPPVDTARAATITAVAAPSDSERMVRARQAVFAISSSAGRATAFLVDSSGIVLTSASVVPGDPSRPVDLYFEAGQKVRGRVLTVDTANGVAAILVPPGRCRRCRTLDLVDADSASQPVEGDTVLALSVAGQVTIRTMRTEVGRVGTRSLAARGRVQPAYAGAPLLSARTGAVVALASLRSGGTTILVPGKVLRDGLARARSFRDARGIVPNDSVIRSWPARAVDNVVLTEAERRRPEELAPYRTASNGFAILAMTPQVMVWRAATYSTAAETNPFEISSRTSLGPDPIDAWPEWKTVRNERRAIVAFQVAPDKSLIPEHPRGIVDFKNGDFVSMKLLRDKQELVPLETARIPAVANVAEYREKKKDIYNAGIYVYHPADFAPRTDGTPAEYEALIVDARRPDRPTNIRLPAAMLQAITRDVGGWMR